MVRAQRAPSQLPGRAARVGAMTLTASPRTDPMAADAAPEPVSALLEHPEHLAPRVDDHAVAERAPAVVVLAGVGLAGAHFELPNIILLAALGLRAAGAFTSLFGAEAAGAPAACATAGAVETAPVAETPIAADVTLRGEPSSAFG